MSAPELHSKADVPRETFARVLPLGWAYVGAYAAIDFSLGAYVAAVLTAVSALILFPLAQLMARRQAAITANFVLLIALNLAVLAGQVFLGKFAGFIFFFAPLAVLPVLLFEASQTGKIRGGVLLALTGWFAGEVSPLHRLAAAYIPVSLPQASLHFINFLSGFAFTMIFVRIYVNTIRRIDDERIRAAEHASTELRLMFDSMVEGVVIQDAAGFISKMNCAAAEILNVDPSAKTFQYGLDVQAFDVSGRPLSLDELPSRTALKTGRAQLGVSMSITRADGRRRWLRVNVSPVWDRGAGYVVTTFVDVTEQRNSQNLLHQIVNGTPDFIFIKDREHRYLTCNDSYAQALGRVPADVLGQTDAELGFGEERVRGFRAEAERVFATNQMQTAETGTMNIDGRFREFHTVKVPLFNDDDDEAYGILTFARDITDLKDAERRMTESSKMASLGQMAGGIAHEINNPLAIISGRVQLLSRHIARDQVDRASAQVALDNIVLTVERISKIIRGLKVFSRNGDTDPFDVIALSQVVEDSLSFCRERFKVRGVDLRIDPIPDVRLLGSAAQLSQILINLLNNAYDAIEPMPKRWIQVSFGAADPARVRIEVTDGGPPIPAEVAEKLMNPFFTTKPAGKGTGLGLTLSHQIAERHKGSLYLDRTSTQTRFVIDLPVYAGKSTRQAA